MSQSEKAVPPVIAIQKQQDAAPKAPATTSGLPHQQFKIVRVRKPDGTIVKVKRPIDGEEAAKLTTVPAKSKHASITQVSDSEKANGVAHPPAKAEPAAVAATEVKTTSEKKSDPVVKTVTSNKPTKAAADPEKVEEASTKSVDPASPVPDPASPNKTARVLNHVANGSRIYRGFHKLHKGSSKLVSVLAPQWGLEDWQEGDEDYSDDDNDSDEDEEIYDEDEDDGKIVKEGGGSHGVLRQDVNAAAKTITTATVSDLLYLNTPGPQPEIYEKETIPTNNSKPSKPDITEKDTKPNTNGKPPKLEKTAVINEKDVSGSDMESRCIENPIASEAGGKRLVKKYTDWSRYIIWAIMILFPMLFLTIAILVAVRDKKPVDDPLGAGTEEALQVAISIWPIIYAGIVAQSLRAYATYKVERGVRLMTLEQLVNSNSVAASVKQPFLLRRFNWITVALLMLWGLSPLATQAMQRISSNNSKTNSTTSNLRYVDTALNNTNYLAANNTVFELVQADFNRLYSAAFLPMTYNQGSDAYSNALIPLLNDYNSTTWQNIDLDTSNYASVYGIPIATVSNYTTYDDLVDDPYKFEGKIEAAYLSFACPPLTILTKDVVSNTFNNRTGLETTLYLGVTAMNGTTKGSLALASMITLNTTDPNNKSNIDTNSSNLTFAFTNCSFSQVFMDANVNCTDGACYISSILPKNNKPYVNSGAANWVTGLLGSSGVTDLSSKTVTATDTERFLMSNGDISISVGRMNLTTVGDITENLAYLMNTLWIIGFAPDNITNSFYNDTWEPLNENLNGTPLPPVRAPGKIIANQCVYKTNWGWLAALMICSLSLLLAGVFSIWWDARTVSPDVLGFASSVVRKSKYVKLPPVESAASGAERARALGDVRVMMQDVKPGASVGRIALGTAHPNAKRLVPGRTYR